MCILNEENGDSRRQTVTTTSHIAPALQDRHFLQVTQEPHPGSQQTQEPSPWLVCLLHTMLSLFWGGSFKARTVSVTLLVLTSPPWYQLLPESSHCLLQRYLELAFTRAHCCQCSTSPEPQRNEQSLVDMFFECATLVYHTVVDFMNNSSLLI